MAVILIDLIDLLKLFLAFYNLDWIKSSLNLCSNVILYVELLYFIIYFLSLAFKGIHSNRTLLQ